MKKFLSVLVLVCMTLHCLSRLEVISYLYSHRHDLAYSLGLRSEKEISTCKSDYFQGTQLTQADDDNDLPASALVAAQEIILGYPPVALDMARVSRVIQVTPSTIYTGGEYHSALSEVFHPPLV